MRWSIVSLIVAVAACGGDGDGGTNGSSAATGSTSDSSATESTGSSSTGSSTGAGTGSGSTTAAETGSTGEPAVCFPDGIYGKCSEYPTCQCMQGGPVYLTCTELCETDADCGDPADFPGAEPVCYPLNMQAEELVCALICESDAECPCGLICVDSGIPMVKICAEYQQ